ncbi:hypothetical protein J2W25_002136 [Variovorax boronicumulans]|uniref:Uncharacterized protein n=2 Tax=Variovorax boronicumulans TaxID=436515 RepID=A0AAW8DU89_9BURK|nr:hypothetical protein [Variovorax boronicumulans]MDP9923115.1 hypothetical protein [Variovorax boronicumulans]
MLANGAARARGEDVDPYPVLRLHTSDADASWVLTALGADGDTAYGLIDVGTGFPELGPVSLSMLASIKGPKGLSVAIEPQYTARKTLSAGLLPVLTWLKELLRQDPMELNISTLARNSTGCRTSRVLRALTFPSNSAELRRQCRGQRGEIRRPSSLEPWHTSSSEEKDPMHVLFVGGPQHGNGFEARDQTSGGEYGEMLFA